VRSQSVSDGRRDRVAFGDRRLHAVRTETAADPPGLGQSRPPAPDGRPVPTAAVLLLQQDRFAIGVQARREPGGGELKEREQAVSLGLVRDQPRQDPGQPHRLVRQVGADPLTSGGCGRALGEDQVEHTAHRAEPLAALVGRRRLERHLCGRERLLGPRDPSLHRGRRYEECPGDLIARQAAEGTERERDLGLARQHRVAGDEHQRQHVVVDAVRIPQQVGVRFGARSRITGGDTALAQIPGKGVPLVERQRRRKESTARRRPTVSNHPAGLRGTPSRGQATSASASASCARSSARAKSEIPVNRASVLTMRADSIRHTAATACRPP
jgi:hypothetical protein